MIEHFDGATFEPARDGQRLTAQLHVVRSLVEGGEWRTLPQISELTGFPAQSISARLRDLRKERFGGYSIERKRLTDGLWAYRMTPASRIDQAISEADSMHTADREGLEVSL